LFEYARALLAFRQHGDSAVAKTALADAIAANHHVPKYLLGRAELPILRPPYISRGDDSEGSDAAEALLDAWRSTPGATAWLAAQTPRSGRRTGGPKGKGKPGGGRRKRR
jgi:hypothetical protein